MMRFYLKCWICKKPWAVDIEKDCWLPRLRAHAHGACPRCGSQPLTEEAWRKAPWPRIPGNYPHKVMGQVKPGRKQFFQVENRPPCDGRCTNAPGPSCDCRCGGQYHGSKMLIQVEVQGEAIPQAGRL